MECRRESKSAIELKWGFCVMACFEMIRHGGNEKGVGGGGQQCEAITPE